MLIKENWAGKFVSEFAGLLLLTADGQVLVRQSSLEAAITWIRSENMILLGMEGFSTDGAQLIPMPDYIADFSNINGTSTDRAVKSADAANRVAAEWTAVPFVELVVEHNSSN